MWRPCLRETLSIGNALEILQFCTKLVTYSLLTCPSQEPHSRQRCRSWVWIGKSSFFDGLSQNHYQSQWWLAMWKLYLKKNLQWYRIKLQPNLSVIHAFKNDVCKIPVVFVQAPKYPPVAETVLFLDTQGNAMADTTAQPSCLTKSSAAMVLIIHVPSSL